jgi:putative transposase
MLPIAKFIGLSLFKMRVAFSLTSTPHLYQVEVLVDTLGNLLKVIVTAANVADVKAAMALLEQLPKALLTRLKRIWADGGYRGDFVEWVQDKFKEVVVDITLRSDDQKGFQVIPWRWVVERTFAWLGAYRRLSKDYEFSCQNSESMIYIASIHRLLKRLAPVA